MKHFAIKSAVLLVSLVLLLGSVPLRADEKSVQMSLDDCIMRALEHNLDVKVETLNPEIAQTSVARAKEKFLPELSFSFNRRDTESASYSWLDAADRVSTQYRSYSGEISQFLPTGGWLSISLEGDETDTNRSFQTINPRFGGTLRFDLTQPLLRNFGIDANRKEIVVAKNNLEISKSRFKSILMDTIYSVEEAYWNLVYSRENLKVKQQSLELAEELLAKNRRSVEIGALARIEIKSAEAEVATRRAEILEAEALVENNEDRLKTLVNFNTGIGSPYIRIIPVDQPGTEEKRIDLGQAISTAQKYRPDLEEGRLDVKNKQTEFKYTRNQLMPDLSLQASYWSPGISGTQLIYKDDNPLTGEVVDTVPGTSADSLKDAFRFLYPNWSVGLALTIPLSSLVSRSQAASARLNLDQARLRLQAREQQVLLEIKNGVRAVQTSYQRVLAYRDARELTQQKLAAEEEKLKVGQSTSYNVFLYQRDLSSAQSNELKATIDHVLASANLERTLGTSLKNRNIKVKDIK